MLRSGRVNAPAKFEETRLIPLGGIGHDLGKQVQQSFVLFRTVNTAADVSVVLAHLKDGGDEHGVCVGKTEEGCLGIRGLFKTREGPNHGGVLGKSVVEIRPSSGFRRFDERRAYFSAQFQSLPSSRLDRGTHGAAWRYGKLVREHYQPFKRGKSHQVGPLHLFLQIPELPA